MGTPQPPSKFWQGQIDDPIEQDADYEFDPFDRAYIDSQILAIETKLLPLLGVLGGLAIAGTGIVRVEGGTVATTASIGADDQLFGTKHDGSDVEWFTPGGDVTYSNHNFTVTGIHDTSLPAMSGTNTVLTWTGSVLQWVTAAGGGGGISSPDLQTNGTNDWVIAISGANGTGSAALPVHVPGFAFDRGQNNPTFSQDAQNADVVAPKNMFFSAQGPYSGATTTARQTPGGLVFDVATPIGSGVNAAMVMREGGTPFFRMDNGSIGFGAPAIWYGPFAAAPTVNNVFLAFSDTDGGGVALFSPSSRACLSIDSGVNDGTIGLFSATVFAPGNVPAIYMNIQSALVGTFIVATNGTASPTYVFEAGLVGAGPVRHFTALNQLSDGTTTSNLPTGTGDGITILYDAATVPTAGAGTVGGKSAVLLFSKGGQLWIQESAASGGANFKVTSGGGGGGGPTWANDLAGSTSLHQFVGALSGGGGGGGAIALANTAWIQASLSSVVLTIPSNPILSIDASGSLYLIPKLGQSLNFEDGGGTQFAQLNASGLTFQGTASEVVFPNGVNGTIGFAANLPSGTGGNLNLSAQKSLSGTSGKVQLQIFAPTSGTTEAYVQVIRGSTTVAQLGVVQGSTSTGALYLAPGVSPSNINFTLADSGSIVQMNSGTGLVFTVGGSTTLLNMTSNGIAFGVPLIGLSGPLQFAADTLDISGGITVNVPLDGKFPILILTTTSGSGGGSKVIFPNVRAMYFVDTSACGFGGGTATLETATPGAVVGFNHLSITHNWVYCDGNNNMFVSPFNV